MRKGDIAIWTALFMAGLAIGVADGNGRVDKVKGELEICKKAGGGSIQVVRTACPEVNTGVYQRDGVWVLVNEGEVVAEIRGCTVPAVRGKKCPCGSYMMVEGEDICNPCLELRGK